MGLIPLSIKLDEEDKSYFPIEKIYANQFIEYLILKYNPSQFIGYFNFRKSSTKVKNLDEDKYQVMVRCRKYKGSANGKF